MPTKNGDKSQVDNSRLNISGEEALVIVDGRVFRTSIDLKRKKRPIPLVLQNSFNYYQVSDVRVWMEVSVRLVKWSSGLIGVRLFRIL